MAKKATKEKETLVIDLISFLADLCEISGNKFYSSLTADEQEIVFAHIMEISKERTPITEYERVFKDSRDFVIHFLDDKNYNPKLPNAKKGEGMKHIPYEIKALMWYMAYRAIEIYDSLEDKSVADAKIRAFIKDVFDKNRRAMKGISNQLMIDIYRKDTERKRGYSFSKKTFQDFAMAPSRYYEATHYTEILMQTKYQGEKRNVLGGTIKYLVSFARDYENFLDLFGGSGRVTLVVPKVDRTDYYINEWNFSNVNYYNVLGDDELYPLLKAGIEEVNKLIENEVTIEAQVEKAKYIYDKSRGLVTAFESVFNSCEPGKNTIETFGKNALSINANSGTKEALRSIVFSTNQLIYNNLYKYAQLIGVINNTNNSHIEERELSNKIKLIWAFSFIFRWSFTGSGGKSERGFINASSLKSYLNYDLKNLDSAHKEFRRVRSVYNSDALYDLEFIIEAFTNKASKAYEPYEDVLKSLWGHKNEIVPTYQGNVYRAIQRLGGKIDSATGKLVNEPRKFRTLIYCDSPYLFTDGYCLDSNKKDKSSKDKTDEGKQNETGEIIVSANGDIDEKGMKKLINRFKLFSEANNDFIFSCRTNVTTSIESLLKNSNSTSTEENRLAELNIYDIYGVIDPNQRSKNGSIYGDSLNTSVLGSSSVRILLRKLQYLLKANWIIYNTIFKAFEDFTMPIYVAVCLPREKKTDIKIELLKKYSIDYNTASEEDKKRVEEEAHTLYLKQYLQNLDTVEAFITTIKAPTLPSYYCAVGKKYKEHYIKVYPIQKFNNLLRQYMLMSDYADKWTVIRSGRASAELSDNPQVLKDTYTVLVPQEEADQKEKEHFKSSLKVIKNS